MAALLKNLWKRSFRDEPFRQKLRFLREVFLFRGLGGRALAAIARAMMEKSYAEGETVFAEGDVGRALFIVARGRVRLSQGKKAPGKGGDIALLQAGDFFGEMALLDELPRSASAHAASPATLYILYKSQLDALSADNPAAAVKVLHALARLLSARLRRGAANGAAESPR
ncbi:MAG: cyclic nucleotide-binding domain-containing protein [Elusimicrobiota bacterium]